MLWCVSAVVSVIFPSKELTVGFGVDRIPDAGVGSGFGDGRINIAEIKSVVSVWLQILNAKFLA